MTTAPLLTPLRIHTPNRELEPRTRERAIRSYTHMPDTHYYVSSLLAQEPIVEDLDSHGESEKAKVGGTILTMVWKRTSALKNIALM